MARGLDVALLGLEPSLETFLRGFGLNASGKPLWLEGMFLRPQHLQQYDRWIDTNLEQRAKDLIPYSWGVRRIEFSADASALGQIQISDVDVVFPDGTIFSTSLSHVVSSARQIRSEHQGKKVFLALPLKAAGGLDVSEADKSDRRYLRREIEAQNNTEAERPAAQIQVGALTARLIMEGESLDETISLPIAQIDSVESNGAVQLSSSFIPPVLNVNAAPYLKSLMEQVRSLLRKRGQALAANAAGQGASTRAGLMDLMMLGVTNRNEVLLSHMIASGRHAPESLYRDLISLIGEISAYGSESRRPPDVPAYNHLDLRSTFDQVIEILRGQLSFVVEQNAVNIQLVKRDFGVWLGETSDRMVYQNREFVLIAHANVGLEALRSQMPIQVKIGPVEKIRELVNLQLPGIPITPMSVAPREIPYIQNAVYFRLDTNNELWPQLQSSAAFALHLSGDYPGLGLELWAIQKGS